MSEEFDPNQAIESAWTPPASWYQSSEFYAAEKKSIFRSTWQVVGRVEQLQKAGDYFAGEIGDESYVVVRGEDQKIRAFFNVCRHHATQVAQGEGCADHFKCPYHGWAYKIDGSLLGAPKMGSTENFAREDYGLVPMPLCQWGPFIAIQPNIRDESGPLSELKDQAPELHDALEGSGWRELKFYKRVLYDVPCNWKVYVDNYLDGGYHVSVLHGDLADQLNLKNYETRVFKNSVIQSCSGSQSNQASANLRERVGGEAIYGWVFPNFMVNRYGPFMDTNFVVPISPTQCRVVFDYYCAPEKLSDEAFLEESLKASDKVQQEDDWICRSVQKGLASAAYDKGRYAPKLETGAFHFHKLLHKELFGS